MMITHHAKSYIPIKSENNVSPSCQQAHLLPVKRETHRLVCLLVLGKKIFICWRFYR